MPLGTGRDSVPGSPEKRPTSAAARLARPLARPTPPPLPAPHRQPPRPHAPKATPAHGRPRLLEGSVPRAHVEAPAAPLPATWAGQGLQLPYPLARQPPPPPAVHPRSRSASHAYRTRDVNHPVVALAGWVLPDPWVRVRTGRCVVYRVCRGAAARLPRSRSPAYTPRHCVRAPRMGAAPHHAPKRAHKWQGAPAMHMRPLETPGGCFLFPDLGLGGAPPPHQSDQNRAGPWANDGQPRTPNHRTPTSTASRGNEGRARGAPGGRRGRRERVRPKGQSIRARQSTGFH